MSKNWTISQSTELLNIPKPRGRDWFIRGYIEPDHPTSGQGKLNLLSKNNLYQLKVFDFLIDQSVSRDEAAKIVKEIENYKAECPYLAVKFKKTLKKPLYEWLPKPSSIENNIKYVIIINCNAIFEEVDKALEKSGL